MVNIVLTSAGNSTVCGYCDTSIPRPESLGALLAWGESHARECGIPFDGTVRVIVDGVVLQSRQTVQLREDDVQKAQQRANGLEKILGDVRKEVKRLEGKVRHGDIVRKREAANAEAFVFAEQKRWGAKVEELKQDLEKERARAEKAESSLDDFEWETNTTVSMWLAERKRESEEKKIGGVGGGDE